MSHFLQELRYSVRTLSKQPALTSLIIVVLGVGIGATTAIFSVAEAVLFRPLPYEDPDRLVLVWNRLTQSGVEKSPVAAPDLVDYQEQTELFESFVGMFGRELTLTGGGMKPTPIFMAQTTSEMFSILGVELLMGEMYGPEDEGQGEPNVINSAEDEPPAPLILSYEFWQRQYGGDPEILGRPVEIDGQRLFVEGVAPKDFRLVMPKGVTLPNKVDAWSPFPFDLSKGGRTTQWLTVLGRLKPGATLAGAQGEMDNVAARQREQFDFHRNVGMEIRVVPLYEELTQEVGPVLLALLGAAVLLLLLTFVNVANLLMLRAAARQKEIAIRAALGSSLARLVVHSLAESTLLALAGGAAGLLLARWGIFWLRTLQVDNLPRAEDVGINATVLTASLGMVLLAAWIGGLALARRIPRHDLSTVLGDRGGSAASRQPWRKILVVAEVAVSLLLLIGTGLVYRTAANIGGIDPGYRTRDVLTAKLSVPSYRYSTPLLRGNFFREIHRRVSALAGVHVVGGVQPLPLSPEGSFWYGPWSVDGMNPEDWSQNEADYRQILPGYFASMDIRLLKGRTLSDQDNRPDAQLVAVVDELFARRAWPGEEAVGKRLMLGQFDDTGTGLVPVWVEVVGVVEHVRDLELTRDGRGSVYFPVSFWNYEVVHLTLHSATSDLSNLVGPLEEAVRSLDPDLLVTAVRPLQDYLDQALAPTRFALTTISLFALFAVVLATVGLYGVVAAAVHRRRQEIGIRMTFGARRGQVLWMVLRQGLGLTAVGVTLGLLAALLLTRGLSSLLFGVTPTDPGTFVVLGAAQVVVALVASLIPAWRATSVDPVQVLRSE